MKEYTTGILMIGILNGGKKWEIEIDSEGLLICYSLCFAEFITFMQSLIVCLVSCSFCQKKGENIN